MLNNSNQPSTMGGIKRYAKQIKTSKGVSHHKALKLAAQHAGYENFAHARKRLHKNSKIIDSSYPLFFTVYWYDRRSDTYKSGREILEISLSKPLLQIANKSEFKSAAGLGCFRLAAQDHFVSDHVSRSQEGAINRICAAVRVLRFMESTGLKPSKDYDAVYPDRNEANKLPKADHLTKWYDPATGQFIFTDEPYLKPVVEGERAVWAKKHNWHLKASKWPGMYYPHHTSLFVATDASNGYDIERLMGKIDRIPTPITAENWSGISSSGYDTFVSPLANTIQDKKNAVARGTIYREPGRKTVPMKYWNAPENERRPNASMAVEAHQRAARLIQAVEQSAVISMPVYTRLLSIKSKLEDWFFAEHERSVTNNCDLFYYEGIADTDPYVSKANSTRGVTNLLKELKMMLQEAYIDCEPLRKMTRKINTAIELASKPK